LWRNRLIGNAFTTPQEASFRTRNPIHPLAAHDREVAMQPSYHSVPASPARIPLPASSAVATLLTPAERQRVDAAGVGCYTALHRESFDDLLGDLRHRRVNVVLLSAARYQSQHAPQVARLVREYPRVAAVALVSAAEPLNSHALLALGQHGVRALVDARDPNGWRDLRELVVHGNDLSIERLALQRIRIDLPGVRTDCVRFFEAIFAPPPLVTTVLEIARANGVVPSTLTSRFFRYNLPAPKRYLAFARLVRAARMLENPGFSISHVANVLEYSSPQSFSRHLRLILRLSPMRFRARYTGEQMLDEMRAQLVLPHREALQQFEPFATTPLWGGARDG
jgi:AraC-like DNA-binding protein